MSDETAPELRLPLRMMKQTMADVGSLRDDLAVLTATAMRQDGMLTEVRAMRSQHSRFGDRLRDLETNVNEKLAP